MLPLRGIRLQVLPHFRSTLLSDARIAVSDGVRANDDGILPCEPWHPATPEELLQLTSAHAEADRECIGLLEISKGLLERWWEAAEDVAQPGAEPSPSYERFVAEVAEFLAFKGLALSAGEQVSVEMSEAPAEIAFRLGGNTGPDDWLTHINLGEDPIGFAFLDASPVPGARAVRLALPPRAGVRFRPRQILGGRIPLHSNSPELVLKITAPAPGARAGGNLRQPMPLA